jgi:hypothetical protein
MRSTPPSYDPNLSFNLERILLLFKLFIRFYDIKNTILRYNFTFTPLRIRQVRLAELVAAPAPTEDMSSPGAGGATGRAPRTSPTAVETACRVHWSTA